MTNLKTIIAALGVAVLLLGACGDDDDSPGGAAPGGAASGELVDAISAAIVDAQDPDGPIGRSEADCFAGRFVGSVGDDRLEQLGVTAEAVRSGTSFEDFDWNDAEIEQAVDSLVDCVDFDAFLTAEMLAEGFSAEQASCVLDALGDDLWRGLARAAALGDEADPAAEAAFFSGVVAAMSDCGVDG